MAQASLLLGVRHLPEPGIEPVSLALQGGFLTTGPSGRPRYHLKSHTSEGASLLFSVLGEALSFSPLSVVLAGVLCQILVTKLRKFPSISWLLRVLS